MFIYIYIYIYIYMCRKLYRHITRHGTTLSPAILSTTLTVGFRRLHWLCRDSEIRMPTPHPTRSQFVSPNARANCEKRVRAINRPDGPNWLWLWLWQLAAFSRSPSGIAGDTTLHDITLHHITSH